MKFTLTLTLALIIALGSAAIVAPLAAVAVAAAGFHFPFPRIFDRTVMVTLLLAMLLFARRLRLVPLLRTGFHDPAGNLGVALRGLVVAMTGTATLLACAFLLGAHGGSHLGEYVARTPKYVLSAVAIAVIEEGFFRAFLLGGMTDDFGRRAALAVSSAIYALTHLVRAPAHFYLTGFHPLAGVQNLEQSLSQLAHPATALPALLGLFLLGLVLGEAFVVTGTVYFSMGLHAGFVIGVKLWPMVFTPGVTLPRWLIGYRHFPLISGFAAWAILLMLLALVPALARRGRPAPIGRRGCAGEFPDTTRKRADGSATPGTMV